MMTHSLLGERGGVTFNVELRLSTEGQLLSDADQHLLLTAMCGGRGGCVFDLADRAARLTKAGYVSEMNMLSAQTTATQLHVEEATLNGPLVLLDMWRVDVIETVDSRTEHWAVGAVHPDYMTKLEAAVLAAELLAAPVAVNAAQAFHIGDFKAKQTT